MRPGSETMAQVRGHPRPRAPRSMQDAMVMAVRNFMSVANAHRKPPAAHGNTPSLGACLLHVTYDPSSETWVYGSEHSTSIETKALEFAMAKARETPDQKTFTYKVTEVHIDVWTALSYLALCAIVVVFMVPHAITTTHTALLVVYLYSFLCFIMSNGMMLHPYTIPP